MDFLRPDAMHDVRQVGRKDSTVLGKAAGVSQV